MVVTRRVGFGWRGVWRGWCLRGAERRREERLGVGGERLAVHRPVDDHGRGQAFEAQRRDDRRRLPVAMGDGGPAALAPRAASAQAGHLGRRPGFVEKHQLLGIQLGLQIKPCLAARLHILALLLAGVRGLFLYVTPRRR